MPMFSTAPGPPQSGSSDDGRTHKSGASPKGVNNASVSGMSPAAMRCTASNDSATVSGTGKSSRTSRCRHLARPPWRVVSTGADGVMRVISGSFCCTAAPFALWRSIRAMTALARKSLQSHLPGLRRRCTAKLIASIQGGIRYGDCSRSGGFDHQTGAARQSARCISGQRAECSLAEEGCIEYQAVVDQGTMPDRCKPRLDPTVLPWSRNGPAWRR